MTPFHITAVVLQAAPGEGSNIVMWLLVIVLLALVAYGLIDVFRAGAREPLPPVEASGWTLLVDGSNFAHRSDEVRLAYLEEILDELERRFEGARLRVMCDANLRHKFDKNDKRRFENLIDGRRTNVDFVETHGRSADEVLLEYARSHERCIVVSNDRFGKGDEVELRIDVPLLQVDRFEAPILLAERVQIYRDEERAASVAVDELIGTEGH